MRAIHPVRLPPLRRITTRSDTWQTSVKKNTHDPVWEETHDFNVEGVACAVGPVGPAPSAECSPNRRFSCLCGAQAPETGQRYSVPCDYA